MFPLRAGPIRQVRLPRNALQTWTRNSRAHGHAMTAAPAKPDTPIEFAATADALGRKKACHALAMGHDDLMHSLMQGHCGHCPRNSMNAIRVTPPGTRLSAVGTPLSHRSSRRYSRFERRRALKRRRHGPLRQERERRVCPFRTTPTASRCPPESAAQVAERSSAPGGNPCPTRSPSSRTRPPRHEPGRPDTDAHARP